MLAIVTGFANDMAKLSFSLREFLANGRLRQNSLAIANAMAWCTQYRHIGTQTHKVKQEHTRQDQAGM